MTETKGDSIKLNNNNNATTNSKGAEATVNSPQLESSSLNKETRILIKPPRAVKVHAIKRNIIIQSSADRVTSL